MKRLITLVAKRLAMLRVRVYRWLSWFYRMKTNIVTKRAISVYCSEISVT